MIGIMMTDAGVVDCFLVFLPYTTIHWMLAILDVGLTSSIAWGLFVCAFLDAKILKDDSILTKIIFFAGIGGIFCAWYYCLIVIQWSLAMLVLYDGIVGLGCGTWVLMQIVLNVQGKRNCEGVKYLVLAALAGGFGFFCIYDAKLNIYLCEKLSCFFAGKFVWFSVTPICAYLIHSYYNATHDQPQPTQNVVPIQ